MIAVVLGVLVGKYLERRYRIPAERAQPKRKEKKGTPDLASIRDLLTQAVREPGAGVVPGVVAAIRAGLPEAEIQAILGESAARGNPKDPGLVTARMRSVMDAAKADLG